MASPLKEERHTLERGVDHVSTPRIHAVSPAAGGSLRALCRRFEISPPTAYTWLARYATEGLAGLADHSRRPHQMPQRPPPRSKRRSSSCAPRTPPGAAANCTPASRLWAIPQYPRRAPSPRFYPGPPSPPIHGGSFAPTPCGAMHWDLKILSPLPQPPSYALSRVPAPRALCGCPSCPGATWPRWRRPSKPSWPRFRTPSTRS